MNPSILSILIISITFTTISSAAIKPEIIRSDAASLSLGSTDYGNIVHDIPAGVAYPSSEKDVVELIRASHASREPFTVAARGRGHSVRGQAMAGGGVVVDMTSLGKGKGKERIRIDLEGMYADVGGEQLWVDVLKEAAAVGVAPVSWTDYVYLSVGGTLSNAGISGQAFMHGPQISNVVELDVVTGETPILSHSFSFFYYFCCCCVLLVVFILMDLIFLLVFLLFILQLLVNNHSLMLQHHMVEASINFYALTVERLIIQLRNASLSMVFLQVMARGEANHSMLAHLATKALINTDLSIVLKIVPLHLLCSCLLD